HWIKQSIMKGLLNTARTVRIPVYMAGLLSKWRHETARLQEELGRAPTPEEVAAALGLSAKKLKVVQKAIRIYNGASQDEAGGGGPSREGRARAGGAGREARLSAAEELGQVLGQIDRLGGREAAVLRLRYGLGGEEPLTLQQIGDRLGLTRERVRQIE